MSATIMICIDLFNQTAKNPGILHKIKLTIQNNLHDMLPLTE